jgi:hypothetical protein
MVWKGVAVVVATPVAVSTGGGRSIITEVTPSASDVAVTGMATNATVLASAADVDTSVKDVLAVAVVVAVPTAVSSAYDEGSAVVTAAAAAVRVSATPTTARVVAGAEFAATVICSTSQDAIASPTASTISHSSLMGDWLL